jgi:hypothetical protein
MVLGRHSEDQQINAGALEYCWSKNAGYSDRVVVLAKDGVTAE